MSEIISGGEPGDEVLAPAGQLALSKSQVGYLFVYFIIVQTVGSAIAFFVLIQDPQTNEEVSFWTTAGAIGMALVGSATYYIRKLYKHLISGEIDINHDQLMEMKRLGGTIYFASRPLFACGFALLVYVLCKGGLSASISGSFKTSTGFQYIVMVLSFLSGFLSGKIVRQLEETTPKWLPKFGGANGTQQG